MAFKTKFDLYSRKSATVWDSMCMSCFWYLTQAREFGAINFKVYGSCDMFHVLFNAEIIDSSL